MSFLDNFSFAFQDVSLFSKTYTTWKYWDKIESSEVKTDFKWVIQKKKDFSEVFIDDNKNLKFTSMDFELRSQSNISPKKWDRIESNGLSYNVIYPYPPVIIWGKHDHNVCIIRLND